MISNAICEKLTRLGARRDVPLSSICTFRIGGPASYVIEASSSDTVIDAVSICREEHIPVAVVGNGSNILFPDNGFDGLILKISRRNIPVEITDGRMRVFAGDSLTQIALNSVKNGFAGMERLAGIPGSVGGAVCMNAGAYGGEIKDVLKRVRILKDGKAEWQDAFPDSFGYRVSPYKWPGCVVLDAELQLTPGDGSEMEVMEDCLSRRREKQPLEYPSAGSVFKRPQGSFAGKLIEDAGLKGFRIGGAEISQKHAGFIINRGGGTEKDVLELIDTVQNKVDNLFGVKLEREVLRLSEIVCTF